MKYRIEMKWSFPSIDKSSDENSLSFSVVPPPPEYSTGKRYPVSSIHALFVPVTHTVKH